MTEKAKQDIFVERGMSDGQKIVLPGAGDQAVRILRLELNLHLPAPSPEHHQETSSSF